MVLPIGLLMFSPTVPLNLASVANCQSLRLRNPTTHDSTNQTVLLHSSHHRNHRRIQSLNLVHQPLDAFFIVLTGLFLSPLPFAQLGYKFTDARVKTLDLVPV